MHVWRWLCLVFLMAGAAAQAQDRAPLVIAAGQRGGDAYSAAGAVCRDVNGSTPHTCTILTTDGTVDSVYALNLGDAQLAILQKDVLRAAWQGGTWQEGTWIPGDNSSLRALAVLYPSTLTIVARSDGPMWTFGDLVGGRVAVGAPYSGSNWTFRALMGASGLGEESMSLVTGTEVDYHIDLCEGRVDAVAMVTGHPSIMLSRLAETCSIRLISVDAGTVATLMARDPSYRPATVPAGAYPFVPAPIRTVTTDSVLVAPATLPDAWVADVLAAIHRAPYPGQGAPGSRSFAEICAVVPCHEEAMSLAGFPDTR